MRCGSLPFTLVAIALLPGCSDPPDAGPSRPEPIVLYAASGGDSVLSALIDAYTAETGVYVTVRQGEVDAHVAELIAKRGAPPADVLLVPDIQGVWRAAGEGALLPMYGLEARDRLPRVFRDEEDFWIAVAWSPIAFAHRGDDAVVPGSYAAAGEERFSGRFCLSSSALPVNRTLIANLIAEHGLRPAEIIVRGWVANLALPPFPDEAALLDAIEAGSCGIGIASARALRSRRKAGTDAAPGASVPATAYAEVLAAGINRYARSPDGAARFIDWLLSESQQKAFSRQGGWNPVIDGPDGPSAPPALADRNVGVAGLYADEAARLAERAGYR